MVYTTQRFKVIPKPGEQPISVGEDQIPSPTPATAPLNQLLQSLFPGYQPITFPTPSTTSDGGIPDVVGPGGGGTTGAGLGEGEIVKVEVPSSAASGSTFLIKTTFKNKSASTANFSLRITMPALGINTITPTIALTAGQQSIVESTIILPNVQYGGNFPGGVELRSVTGTNVILFQDSEAFTLAVVGSGTTSGGPAAAITPSASSVLRGQSISINCLNFGANETIDFVAKVGNTVVATDNKIAGANGAAVLSTLTFSTSAPTGTAIITATGRTTNKIATAQVTVTATTTPTATIVPSATTVKQGQSISIACSNFAANEVINFVAKVGVTTVATDHKTAGATGSVVLDTLTFSSSSPLGASVISAVGATSGKLATASVTVIASTTSPTAPSIVPAAYTVQQGKSIAIACTNFGAAEIVDIVAKIGTTTVASDNHTMGSTGAGTEPDLTFSTTGPTGTAVITAKGRISLKTATVNVTVTPATATVVAKIVPSATTVKVGQSISIACSNFGAAERIDFIAKIGTTTVAVDNKTTLSNGTIVLDTLTFNMSTATGTAVITAKGASTGRTATASVTVTSATTTTPTLSTNKTTYTRGEVISCSATGLRPGEMAFFSLTVGGVETSKGTDRAVSSTGTVSGTLNANGLGGGHVHVRGRTSGIHVEKGVTIVSSTTVTARISAPSEVHDGDTFTVSGSGFQGGERVTTTVSGVWKSSSSTYNNKPFSASTTITASSSGTFGVSVKTPEVPSGVSTIATIKSVGLTSGRTATRTISVI